MLLEQLVILLSVHDRLPGRTDLYPVMMGLAAAHLLIGIKPENLLIAARVAAYVLLEHEEGLVHMHAAVVDLGRDELLVAVG